MESRRKKEWKDRREKMTKRQIGVGREREREEEGGETELERTTSSVNYLRHSADLPLSSV